jgi:hypothetical protein
METRSGRGWLVNAFGIFLLVLSLWILAALWAGTSFGATFPLLADLRSQIFADYGSDIFGQTLKSLQISILGDISADTLFADGSSSGWDLTFQDPVPTATSSSGGLEDESSPTPTEELEPPKPTLTGEPEYTSTAEPETPTVTPLPTKTPKPTSTLSPQPVRPILECVKDNHDGTFTAFFGYKNPNSHPIEISIGSRNHFEPGPDDRGQPTRFEPGRTAPYPDAEYSTEFNVSEIVWRLGDKVAIASVESTPCVQPDPDPTPNGEDVTAPILSGGDLSPPPDDLTACEITVAITDLEGADPAWSSGIEWVKLKYQVEGYSDYIYSSPLILKSGGPTGDGGWLGCYSGDIHIEINPQWDPPEGGLFRINLWAKARDYVGLEGYLWLGEYTMPGSCGGNFQ